MAFPKLERGKGRVAASGLLPRELENNESLDLGKREKVFKISEPIRHLILCKVDPAIR